MNKKVALWGSYHNGNFGDDLMAIMLAECLAQHGYKPWVFRLDRILAQKYRIDSTDSLSELLDGAVCCVIGGGAFLVENREENSFFAALLQDLGVLNEALTKRGIPSFGISIGGSGVRDQQRIPPEVWRFVNNPLFAGTTVRLPGDVALLPIPHKEFAFYPDIVLSASDFLARHRASQEPKSDLLLQSHRSPKSATLILPVVALGRILGRRIHFVHTQLARYGESELGSRNSRTIPYEDPADLLAAIAGTRILISCKLHIGVAAVSLGKCFVSFGGLPKTSSFLKAVNRSRFYVRKSSIGRIFHLLLSRRHATNYEREFALDNLESIRMESRQHFEFMLRHVKNCERDTQVARANLRAGEHQLP
jgi:hypothetical protein